MERFEPETVSEMIDIYGSGDALRDAREYVSAIESAVEYASQTLQRLNNHLFHMRVVQPLATSIPFGSAERGTVATYIRRKSGGLLELDPWDNSFKVLVPVTILKSVPELSKMYSSKYNTDGKNRQYCFCEEYFTPMARKHPKELTSIIHRLYFAHDALRRIGENYCECKDIDQAIKDYEADVDIKE